MAATNTVADVLAAKKIYGFSGIPITHNGQMGGMLVGLVTMRDIDFLQKDNETLTIDQVMSAILMNL